MSLSIGTSSGFVVVSPTLDPAESGTLIADNWAIVTHDTSPITATIITEMGWWCSSATEEANYEVGLYAADGVVVPGEAGTILYSSVTNAKGTTSGWKKVTGLSWSISPSTSYWLGIQCDSTVTATLIDAVGSGASGYDSRSGQSTLPNPFSGGTIDPDGMVAIYAVWSVGLANLKTYNTNAKTNIKTINTNVIANVKTLNTNA